MKDCYDGLRLNFVFGFVIIFMPSSFLTAQSSEIALWKAGHLMHEKYKGHDYSGVIELGDQFLNLDTLDNRLFNICYLKSLQQVRKEADYSAIILKIPKSERQAICPLKWTESIKGMLGCDNLDQPHSSKYRDNLKNPELSDFLIRMLVEDQGLMMSNKQKHSLLEYGYDSAEVFFPVSEPAIEINQKHIRQLDSLFSLGVELSEEEVGYYGKRSILIVLLHAPYEDRIRYRSYLERNYRDRELAYAMDKDAVAEGEPQKFGTQLTMMGGRSQLYPVMDSCSLDSLRCSVGLEPICLYLKGHGLQPHRALCCDDDCVFHE